MTNTYLHGTREYVVVDVSVRTADGSDAVVSSVDFSLVQQTAGMPPLGPDIWAGALTVDGKTALLLQGTEDLGYYRIYGRVTDDPEIPIFYCGAIQIV